MELEVNERPKGATRNGLNIIGKNFIFCLDQSLNSLETFTARLAIERGRQENFSLRLESFSARLAIERGRQENFSARLETFSAPLESFSARLVIERGRQENFSARLESFSARLESFSVRLENVNILLMLCK